MSKMRAILVKDATLVVSEVEKPTPKESEVLIEIKAIGLNRADLLHRHLLLLTCFQGYGTLVSSGKEKVPNAPDHQGNHSQNQQFFNHTFSCLNTFLDLRFDCVLLAF